MAAKSRKRQDRPNAVVLFLLLAVMLSTIFLAFSFLMNSSTKDVGYDSSVDTIHASTVIREKIDRMPIALGENNIESLGQHDEPLLQEKLSPQEKHAHHQNNGNDLNFHLVQDLNSKVDDVTPKQNRFHAHIDEAELLAKEGPGYHVVFSTDCSAFQRWQSYLLFYSAFKVHQPGIVTRIASGCNSEEEKREQLFHEMISNTMSSSFKLHLTPHFSTVKDDTGKDTGTEYKFFNKPYGLLHWLEHSDETIEDDDIVILLDPDQVFTRPITNNFSNLEHNILVGKTPKTKVEHGSPFAQKYGLGAKWREFNLETITNSSDTPARKVSSKMGMERYPAGPPYLATAKDMHTIARYWADFVPRVHAEYPHLLAEMYAFCIAAAHAELPMQIVTTLMVSDSSSGRGEGWSLIESIDDDNLCDPSIMEETALPSVLHYCQRYMVGQYMFGKRRMPTNIFSCESPLLKLPPRDIAQQYDYFIPPPSGRKIPQEHTSLSAARVKRDSFMICALTNILNDASLFFQKTNCDSDKNSDVVMDLWLGRNEMVSKTTSISQ